MFRFENPELLWLISLIPIFWLVTYFLIKRSKGISLLGQEAIVRQLVKGRSTTREFVKLILISMALLFFCIAAANPQWGTKREKVKAKGSDIIIALDISRSMLCEDLAPNRLERAKRFVERLIDRLKGERIGLVLFAGNAYLQMPLTTDYAAATLFIKSANTRLAASQGTAIGDAISLSRTVFDPEDNFHKALIIITDGETHDDNAKEMAQAAADANIILFFVGVGTQEGGFVPIRAQGYQDYLRDESGDFVKSTLNPDIMRDLAEAGKGAYYNVIGGESILSELDSKIDQLEKKELEQRSFEDYESYFQLFLFPGLLFLLFNFFLFDRKNKKWGW